MYILSLAIKDFKNFELEQVQFDKGLVLISGQNGQGKTNLLEAIYALSVTKSFRNLPDSMLCRHGTDAYALHARFERQEVIYHTHLVGNPGRKKQLRIDEKAVSRLADHVGKFPVVVLAPDDSQDLLEASESRRSFIDELLCQASSEYLISLQIYQQALKEKNALLKQVAGAVENGPQPTIDAILFEKYHLVLAEEGQKIYQKRKEAISSVSQYLAETYQLLSSGNEVVSLRYSSDYNELSEPNIASASAAMEAKLQKDFYTQRATWGIHRDDLAFQISNYPLKKIASQGQIKSFVIALKLAAADWLGFEQFDWKRKGDSFKPILLLDDIFDKLDDVRIEKLLELMVARNGQVLLTDARPERSVAILKRLCGNDGFQWFRVRNGKISSSDN